MSAAGANGMTDDPFEILRRRIDAGKGRVDHSPTPSRAAAHAALAAVREREQALEQVAKEAEEVLGLMATVMDDLIGRAELASSRPEYHSPGAFAFYASAQLKDLARRISAGSSPGGQE